MSSRFPGTRSLSPEGAKTSPAREAARSRVAAGRSRVRAPSRARSTTSRIATSFVALVAASALAACENVFFHEPAEDGVPIRVSYGMASSVAGQAQPLEDFENADEARIRVTSSGQLLVDRVVGVQPAENGTDKVARVEVPVGDEPVTISVEATLLVDGERVLQGFRSLQIDPDSEVAPQAQIEMLPVLTEGQTRVVLSWGENPRDLDSHMTGPDGQGGQFHVYFANRGSATAPPFVSLDTDDTQGFGPETITIWEQFAGLYCYSVHRFGGTGTLSSSNATVEVFQGDTRVNTFDVPDGTGEVWTVFSLRGDEITPIDRIDDQAPPGVCG